MAERLDHYLDELLRLFWLRPETALWRACDCLLMDGVTLSGSAADLGCGDGTMSFVLAGGRFPKSYDVFETIKGLAGYSKGSDIFNAKAKGTLAVNGRGLRHRFAWGLDHKQGLLTKAARLGLYERTRVADLDRPLPVPSASLDWAFSNILYWLRDAEGALAGWRGALKKNGRVALFVPDRSFPDKAWLYYRAPHSGSRKHLNYLDRGYAPLVKHCYSADRWKKLFAGAGYRVVSHRPYLTDAVMDVWNVGTRPIAHLLISMSQRLKEADRRRSRAEWTAFFKGFFRPIVKEELARRPRDGEAAFHFFVLEARS